MKRKPRKPRAPRNPFVAAALFKKAGEHAKSDKALRRHGKMETGRLAHLEEHPAFTRRVSSSTLGTSTMQSPFPSYELRNAFRKTLICVPVAQLDRALPSEGRGRQFESGRGRHKPNLVC